MLIRRVGKTGVTVAGVSAAGVTFALVKWGVVVAGVSAVGGKCHSTLLERCTKQSCESSFSLPSPALFSSLSAQLSM